ncbi:hypothetical protein AVEN_208445-1 [Araneus ventricosus]|uniref:Uncharacterized protein n=1 Tax=Araneus ventricosus TaxID=182803 RepID=A0A4Y2EG96_ARAVE|nr:hypothetical protein AVEN_208445-1 [Araneus ventricosus]
MFPSQGSAKGPTRKSSTQEVRTCWTRGFHCGPPRSLTEINSSHHLLKNFLQKILEIGASFPNEHCVQKGPTGPGSLAHLFLHQPRPSLSHFYYYIADDY